LLQLDDDELRRPERREPNDDVDDSLVNVVWVVVVLSHFTK
jgi:hypothetical protein